MDNLNFFSSSECEFSNTEETESGPRRTRHNSVVNSWITSTNGHHSPPPTSFRPRKLFTSLAQVFSPYFVSGNVTNRLHPPERKKGTCLWQPTNSLASTVQSRMKSNEWRYSVDEETQAESQTAGNPPIEHCGRFNIGHPLSCNATIDDDPIENDQAKFPSANSFTVSATCQPVFSRCMKKNNVVMRPLAPTKTHNRQLRPVLMNSDQLGYGSIGESPVIVRINRDPFVYSKILEDAIWLPDQREYYFERDPSVFRFVHNYLRRGELHLPQGMCGPLLEKELDDWGIPLGLDIQRCCLGPVMDTKFRLQSLQKFERTLEPKYVKPTTWIRSKKWQSFRAKVWSIIDVSPKFILQRPSRRCESNASGNTDQFFARGNQMERQDSEEQGSEVQNKALYTTQTERSQVSTQARGDNMPVMDNEKSAGSVNLPNGSCSSSPRSSSNDDSERWVRWFRRLYIIHETLTVTAAVIVFMLSTCEAFRVPISLGEHTASDTKHTNTTDHQSINNTPNASQFTLPNRVLVSMDIFFSVTITVDVLTRMLLCPTTRSWLCSIYTLIDILSLIPFYSELIVYKTIHQNMSVNAKSWLIMLLKIEGYVVVLKVFIVLRLFRILRRHRGTRVLLYTIQTTFVDMSIIIVLIMESALFFGATIYFIDPNFRDIPTGFWWAMITMTTVGYGDVVPSHSIGYGVAMVCVITGTLLMSYTIPILVNHFLLYYEHADQLHLMRQLHRTAKYKARRRTLSRYAQKALTSARVLVNQTLTKSMAKT
ncbi:hypothetical protein P879_05223 [Paragonimus westermani]|uniref:Uncharacterized protein n=1 Tax=Paragonimus westermani TaxID=34504 RepID=A0A8T0DGL3_9TREM|nr:hypothetical protein P879_05223 [Paragonimus westermani]